jgi:hypothetical protein
MITGEYRVDQSALEEHNLAIIVRMPVQEWRQFLKQMAGSEAERGAPDAARSLLRIAQRALDEFDKATAKTFSIGEYFTDGDSDNG